ncbi:monocarboxylate transporter 4 isoform X2 [Macrosteles quadrilineatus]|uniref:monocarboxylate transporter 4 isoform X2 n=1 Tax=Macrosteles quadrilineatus TaxID=74068 RepID=UPI0023E1DACD|nr:monocarboxylate transporter 4 isoform X2 [Macrosteles quadrilineatus]
MFSFHKYDVWEIADYEQTQKEFARRQKTESECSCGERNEETARLTEGGEGDMSPPQDEDNLSYCEFHDIPPPPDGGYGWVIVFASFMCNMIVDGIAYTFGVFLGEYVKDFGEGKGKTAWAGSLLSGMYLSVGPIVSALTNKYGCRAVCVTGSLIGCAAFVLSTYSPNVNTLMLTYGFMGGIGFGMIYLPAVVCVGYYFETKRSLATGLAVCGSGFGTFVFAPVATTLLEMYEWRGAHLILAGLILNCAVFGALMRPLEFPKEGPNCKPLLLRMADEKRFQMERGSIGGSYFIVQLPDGSMEKRMKMPINVDPGVHSSFNLDQLVPGTPITPVPTMAVLPTITEAKIPEQSGSSGNSESGSAPDLKSGDAQLKKDKKIEEKKKSEEEIKEPRLKKTSLTEFQNRQAGAIPRNASQPAFTSSTQGLPKNGSVPFFDRIRKTSQGERYKPTLQAIRVSRGNMNSNGDVRKSLHLRLSTASVVGSKNNNTDDMGISKTDMDAESMMMSRISIQARKELIRPLSRKDIFYSGSVMNLPEYQSQRSLAGYRQSVLSLPQYSTNRVNDVERGQSDLCPCLTMPDSVKSVLQSMLDYSLLKNPVFLLIGISNVFGMAGLYVPFVYLVDTAIKEGGIEEQKASFLLSIIGITNTVGRVFCGWVADFPWVNSLLLNNLSLVVTTIAVFCFPLCTTYTQYVIVSVVFGLSISAYISLTSIILVDLLGLDKLTNAFGLLILFRGAAAIVGSPVAGMIYDATLSYMYPFFMASGFFLLATIASFVAPLLKSCVPQEEPPVILDALTPIDEDEEEEGEGDEDHNIPEIVETAPSPVGGQPSKPTIEIKQIESVL